MALAAQARAQELELSAGVDTQQVALNEQILLQVRVAGDRTDLPDPRLPALPNFQVYSSGRSQNVSIANGRIRSEIVHTFVLVPRFVGEATIPAVTLDWQGRTYSTEPIQVRVVRPAAGPQSSQSPTAQPPPGTRRRPGTTPSPGGPALFVTAQVDKPKVFVGEQATLSVRFHTGVALLGNPAYAPPATQGFLSEDLPPHRNYVVNEGGRAYSTVEIRTALFPLEPGSATIGPATIQAEVRQDVGVDPFAPDFFQKFFSQGLLSSQTKELKTDSIRLRVLPLPETDRPAAFTGAVGRYRVKASVNRTDIKVGEAVDLIVTIEGEGNLKTSGAVALPALAAFEVYDTVTSLSLSKKDDVVRSAKTFKTVLLPKASGLVAIPPIRFAHFDPQAERYVETQTAPLELRVAPGASARPAPVRPGAAPGLVAVESDVRHLKSGATPSWSAFLRAAARWRELHTLPIAALLACAGFVLYRHGELQDPVAARRRRALARARDALREAERAHRSGNLDRAATAAADAIGRYLVDKLGPDGAGLPFQKALELLSQRHPGVSGDRLASLRNLWEQLEGARFAPKGSETAVHDGLSRAVAAQLEALERELRA